VRAMSLRLAERFLTGGERSNLIARMLKLTRDASPEVQLQAVLSLGEARDANVDRQLAETVRTHPRNTFLPDALYSGLADRELKLFEHVTTDPAWAANDENTNRIIGGLAKGIFTSRHLAGIERVVAVAAATPGSPRSIAVLDGVTAAAARTRRPLQFTAAPRGWAELANHATTKAAIAKLDPIVHWPGKPGIEAVAVKPLSAEEQARFELGKTLFTATCATCHQATGRGLDGLAPPLLDSEWVLGSSERIIRIALHGLKGPIVVLGREHTGDMPAFKALDDEQLAAVLTYVRREWGHTASPITPAEVKAQRAATADQTDSVSARELVLQVP
jgi:mono/diheme cytochrome c family protein